MTIYLSKDLEQFVHDAVRAGRYATEAEVVNDALIRLKQTMPEDTAIPAPKTKGTKPVGKKKKALAIDELHQQMLARGLISQLPDTDADFDDPDDQLIEIKGEPLSETVIRERR